MDPHAYAMPTAFYTPGRAGFTVKYIIIHVYGEPGQTAFDIGRRFQMEPHFPEISHYVIDRIGDVVQCISEHDRAWANGIVDVEAEPWFRQNSMEQSIAITCVKSCPLHMDEITLHQKSTLTSLIGRIIHRNPAIRWAEANENGGVIGHHALGPIINFACPGTFDWDNFWLALREEAPPPPLPWEPRNPDF